MRKQEIPSISDAQSGESDDNLDRVLRQALVRDTEGEFAGREEDDLWQELRKRIEDSRWPHRQQ